MKKFLFCCILIHFGLLATPTTENHSDGDTQRLLYIRPWDFNVSETENNREYVDVIFTCTGNGHQTKIIFKNPLLSGHAKGLRNLKKESLSSGKHIAIRANIPLNANEQYFLENPFDESYGFFLEHYEEDFKWQTMSVREFRKNGVRYSKCFVEIIQLSLVPCFWPITLFLYCGSSWDELIRHPRQSENFYDNDAPELKKILRRILRKRGNGSLPPNEEILVSQFWRSLATTEPAWLIRIPSENESPSGTPDKIPLLPED